MGKDSNLRVDADDLVAFLTNISEDTLVAFDAVRVVIPEHISLAGQGLVALPTGEVPAVPVFGHGFRVFSAENEL